MSLIKSIKSILLQLINRHLQFSLFRFKFNFQVSSVCVHHHHLLPFVLGEVEDDNVRPVSSLREGEQLPVLVDGQRSQVLPPGMKFKKKFHCTSNYKAKYHYQKVSTQICSDQYHHRHHGRKR